MSKGAVLWSAGDSARTIGILDKGRLGIGSSDTPLGVLVPKMILGETAVLTLEAKAPRRTAAVFALEDETEVVEYPVFAIRQMVESGLGPIPALLLKTLVGQIARNCLIIMSACKDSALVRLPMKGLLKGVVASTNELAQNRSWAGYMKIFTFLMRLRDDLGAIRAAQTSEIAVGYDVLDRLTATVKEMFGEEDAGVAIEEFLKTEAEWGQWAEL